ncbi:Tetratricopeptide TPR_1 repeat-containing protein [Cyclobacterium marinum DSM 745]|uniref:Tetratricopeptide TPR_1 repeat-containing protein n=1 Tax=Cyclobacterium marinum (strain ATCC 25205 / DSM 745 / LMG 13164 / NCIMB 1802) TaxID=880070 RepID=G0IX71_CYCMS|nr:Tetratricopeptide TPR_1 repeat-containing protein [Cyclobacterium marinum DSM 745]|tara:strand:- start:33993 stop:36575 length:2583 start_codon:yes stop_codon:yes gene_type:complete
MEPFSATWMIASLLSGVIGARGDSFLCQGVNKLYKKINENIDVPANQHIQWAIRKSYLNATLLAVAHLQKQRKRYSLTNRSWENLQDLKSYIKEQIGITEKKHVPTRQSALDKEYREVLFPKEGASAEERMPELIAKLKESIISELGGNKRRIESALKSCIHEGWTENSKEMDFYQLTCAYFTQELKDNPQLSTYIQTEYLDQITTAIGVVSLKVEDIEKVMFSYYELYKDLLSKVNKILDTVIGIRRDIENFSEKTAQLVTQSIKEHIITERQITISEEYQKYVKAIEDYEKGMVSIRSQIEGVHLAITQVDPNTKPILKENLSNLESQLLAKGNEKDKQEIKLNEFVKNVISLAKQLNSTNNLGSERLDKARALFANGKYNELNEVLNESEIDKDIAKFKEQGKILANELTIKAQAILLNKPNDWFEEADRLFAKAISVIEDYNTTFNYAFFLAEHRQINKAGSLFQKAIYYCTKYEEKANILNNLGILQLEKNEFENAEKSFQEALLLYMELSKENPQTFLVHVGTSLNNLGNLQRDSNKLDNAEISYQNALEIYRKLAATNPQIFLANIGDTLNNLGILQRVKIQLDKAGITYEEALKIRRKLAKDNPKTFLAGVATTLNNLGNLQRDNYKFDKAEISLLEALEVYRKLAKENPQTFLKSVSDTLINLGNLQRLKNEYDKAEKFYEKALEIYRKLAESNPQTYLLYNANALNNLGNLQRIKKDYNMAEKSLHEALKIYRELDEVNPQIFLANIAITLNNLGILKSDKKNFKNAENYFQEAFIIRKDLSKDIQFLIPYGDSCNSLATLYRWHLVDKQKSIFYAKGAIKAYASFIPRVPHAVRWSKKAEDILAYWEKN